MIGYRRRKCVRLAGPLILGVGAWVAAAVPAAAAPGANASGPYDATGIQGPGPGQGNGNAVGQPCDGCVGDADNKNPLGQLPGPEDANVGYECEAGPNFGVGTGNPAHTTCGTTVAASGTVTGAGDTVTAAGTVTPPTAIGGPSTPTDVVSGPGVSSSVAGSIPVAGGPDVPATPFTPVGTDTPAPPALLTPVSQVPGMIPGVTPMTPGVLLPTGTPQLATPPVGTGLTTLGVSTVPPIAVTPSLDLPSPSPLLTLSLPGTAVVSLPGSSVAAGPLLPTGDFGGVLSLAGQTSPDAASQTAAANRGTLATTGASIADAVLVAVGALALGLAFAGGTRRPRPLHR